MNNVNKYNKYCTTLENFSDANLKNQLTNTTNIIEELYILFSKNQFIVLNIDSKLHKPKIILLVKNYNDVYLYKYLRKSLKSFFNISLLNGKLSITPKIRIDTYNSLNIYLNKLLISMKLFDFNYRNNPYIEPSYLTKKLSSKELNTFLPSIDDNIKNLISFLWCNNFETVYSCSALSLDHVNNNQSLCGYILIKLNFIRDYDLYQYLKNNLGDNIFITTANNGLIPCISIRNYGKNDEELLKNWRDITELIKDFIN